MKEKWDIYDICAVALLILNAFGLFVLAKIQKEIDDFNKKQNQVIEVRVK